MFKKRSLMSKFHIKRNYLNNYKKDLIGKDYNIPLIGAFSTPKTCRLRAFSALAVKIITESSFLFIISFSPFFISSNSLKVTSPSKTEFCIQLRCFLRYPLTLLTLSTLMSYTIMAYKLTTTSQMVCTPQYLSNV